MDIIKEGTITRDPEGNVVLRDWELANFSWPPTEEDIRTLQKAVADADVRSRLKGCYCTGDTRMRKENK